MVQQTVVDYLIEQLQAPCKTIPSHIIEQAKQIETKQNMINFDKGFNEGYEQGYDERKSYEDEIHEYYKRRR